MPRHARVQPIVLFAVAGLVVLGGLALLYIPKAPPKPVSSNAASLPLLAKSPLSATALSMSPADGDGAGYSAEIDPTLNTWVIEKRTQDGSELRVLVQAPVVRGALTMLRDAMQNPSIDTTRSEGVVSEIEIPVGADRKGWHTVKLIQGKDEAVLLVESQPLGGRTRVLHVAGQSLNSDSVQLPRSPVFTGSADLAAIFRDASIAGWRDASAMPDVGGSVQELAMRVGASTLRVVKGSEGRWMMTEPAPAQVEKTSVEQVLAVLRSVQVAGAVAQPTKASVANSGDPSSNADSPQRMLDRSISPGTPASDIVRSPSLSITLISQLDLPNSDAGSSRLVQSLFVGAATGASGGMTTRNVVAHTMLQARAARGEANDGGIEGSSRSFSPIFGSLETKGLFEFVQAPEALLPKLALRGGVADVGSLHVRFESELLKNVNVIAPAERTDKGLLLVRATNTQRAELKAEWVSPAAAEPLQLNAATKTQQELASAISELLAKVEPESLLLLRDANSLAKVFDIGTDKEQPAGSIGAGANTNRQRVRGAASLTVRDLGGAANLTGAFGLSTSGEPRVLLRVGHVLRVWNAKEGAAKRVHELLLQEVPPEG